VFDKRITIVILKKESGIKELKVIKPKRGTLIIKINI